MDRRVLRTVVIGHRQGGLVAKVLVIDPGSRLWDRISRRPLGDLRMSPESKPRVRAALFVHLLFEVRRVVIITIPHRGSHVPAMWITQFLALVVTLPVGVAVVGRELLANNTEEPTFDVRRRWLASVYGMTPGSTFVRALEHVQVD